MRASIAALTVGMAFCLAGPAHAAPVTGTDFPLTNGPIVDAPGGKPSKDVSGIACAPAVEGRQRCLIVTDEGLSAQWADLTSTGLTVGLSFPVLPETRPGTIAGTIPDTPCADQNGTWKELDGEAVAYDGTWFYVTGSHGCSRHGDRFNPSTFVLARIAPGGGIADQPPAIGLTHRLAAVLRTAATVGPFYGTALQEKPADNGMNVEGLAVMNGTLYAGLRAPVVNGAAFLVKTAVAPLFAANGPEPACETIPLFLGGRGIRDLAALPDGRLLVLAGPAQEEAQTYAVYVVNLDNTDADRARLVTELTPPDKKAKAEALLPLAPFPTTRILVLFDGVAGGHPSTYPVSLPSGQ